MCQAKLGCAGLKDTQLQHSETNTILRVNNEEDEEECILHFRKLSFLQIINLSDIPRSFKSEQTCTNKPVKEPYYNVTINYSWRRLLLDHLAEKELMLLVNIFGEGRSVQLFAPEVFISSTERTFYLLTITNNFLYQLLNIFHSLQAISYMTRPKSAKTTMIAFARFLHL